jgi:hypothetical protein
LQPDTTIACAPRLKLTLNGASKENNMRYFKTRLISLILCAATWQTSYSQTLGDPFPMMGGANSAAQAATNYAMLSADGKPLSPQEKAKRQAHRQQHRDCKRSAERMPIATRQRNDTKYRCDNAYIQQQATWKDVTPTMISAQQRRADHFNCRSHALEVEAGPARQRIRTMCEKKYPRI